MKSRSHHFRWGILLPSKLSLTKISSHGGIRLIGDLPFNVLATQCRAVIMPILPDLECTGLMSGRLKGKEIRLRINYRRSSYPNFNVQCRMRSFTSDPLYHCLGIAWRRWVTWYFVGNSFRLPHKRHYKKHLKPSRWCEGCGLWPWFFVIVPICAHPRYAQKLSG